MKLLVYGLIIFMLVLILSDTIGVRQEGMENGSAGCDNELLAQKNAAEIGVMKPQLSSIEGLQKEIAELKATVEDNRKGLEALMKYQMERGEAVNKSASELK